MSEPIRVIEEKPTRAECVKSNLRLQIAGFFQTRSDKSVLQFRVTRGGGQNAIPGDTDTYYSAGPDQCTTGMKIICHHDTTTVEMIEDRGIYFQTSACLWQFFYLLLFVVLIVNK